MRIPITVAIEGTTDEPVARRILASARLDTGTIHVSGGKKELNKNLSGYNAAAQFAPWLVIRDMDHDALCAPDLVSALLPLPAKYMCFRVAVREVESWLLADNERMSAFLGVPTSRLPKKPDEIDDPKRCLVELARRSRRRSIRTDMVPALGTSAAVGPAYSVRIVEFATRSWRPAVAAVRSPSLAACLEALRRWRSM